MKRNLFGVMVCLVVELLAQASACGQTILAKAPPQQRQRDVPDANVSPLITVAELAAKIEAGDQISLVEVGVNRESYDLGHIDGAHYVDWVKDITDLRVAGRYNIVDQPSMEALLSKLGVASDSHIVVYDRFASRLSTRMYWTLKVWGHDKVQVLDGGFVKWSSDQSTTDVAPKVRSTNYKIVTVRNELRADAKRVEELVRLSAGTLIDGRPVKQFTGEAPGVVFHTGKPHQKRGHIPGAINIPWKNNLNTDGTFKSAKELRKMYVAGNVDFDGPVVTYCNEGLHAAMPWFVASAILNFENVSVYDDSMAQWANSDRPVETQSSETPETEGE